MQSIQTVTEAIINLQALVVKSHLLNALLIDRKAFPIGYHGAQVLRPASRYSRDLTQPVAIVCGSNRPAFPCPNVTTASVLDVLMAADGLDPLMKRAVSAATRRTRALAGSA